MYHITTRTLLYCRTVGTALRHGFDFLVFYNEYAPYWRRIVACYDPHRIAVPSGDGSTVRGG